MVSQLDEAKAELLGEAAKLAPSTVPTSSQDPSPAFLDHPGPDRPAPGGETRAPLRPLYRPLAHHDVDDDLADHSPGDVAGVFSSIAALAANRPQGTAKIHVFTPTTEVEGW